jgi:hypothetical protein
MGKDKMDKATDKLIREACRDLIKERDVLIGLLIEARDRICLECYGSRPAPETVETMKKINKWLGA